MKFRSWLLSQLIKLRLWVEAQFLNLTHYLILCCVCGLVIGFMIGSIRSISMILRLILSGMAGYVWGILMGFLRTRIILKVQS